MGQTPVVKLIPVASSLNHTCCPRLSCTAAVNQCEKYSFITAGHTMVHLDSINLYGLPQRPVNCTEQGIQPPCLTFLIHKYLHTADILATEV